MSSFTKDEKEQLFEKIKEIHNLLSGGDMGEKGLIYKNQRNTEFRLWWEKFGWVVLAGFAGVPCTVVAGLVLHFVKGG